MVSENPHASFTITTCVIGGGGFIGRVVVDALLAIGRRVIVLGRESSIPGLPTAVVYRQNALEDTAGVVLREVLAQSEEIIDLAYATVPQTSFQDPVNDLLVNVPEAVRLFELAAGYSIRKFVWISSGGTVYGRTPAIPIAEDHPTLPLSPYGITKLAIEKYAHMYFESRGLPIVCVRPSNAFGPGQRPYAGQGFIATAIASILENRELTLFGEQGTVRDYLHVADVARGIVAVLEHGRAGEVYNLGSQIGLTNRQILDTLAPLAAAAGHQMQVRVLPPRPFDVPVNILNVAKIRQETGWEAQLSLSEALQQTWEWYAARAAAGPLTPTITV